MAESPRQVASVDPRLTGGAGHAHGALGGQPIAEPSQPGGGPACWVQPFVPVGVGQHTKDQCLEVEVHGRGQRPRRIFMQLVDDITHQATCVGVGRQKANAGRGRPVGIEFDDETDGALGAKTEIVRGGRSQPHPSRFERRSPPGMLFDELPRDHHGEVGDVVTVAGPHGSPRNGVEADFGRRPATRR